MNLKKSFVSTLTFASLLLMTSSAFALTVDQIGDTFPTTQTFTTWTYSSANPIFAGTAELGSAMTLDVDGVVTNFTADGTGSWVQQSTAIPEGTHTITIADSAESKTFTLTIGGVVSDDTSVATDSGTLPVSGAVENTFFLLTGGLLLVLGGIKLSKQLS